MRHMRSVYTALTKSQSDFAPASQIATLIKMSVAIKGSISVEQLTGHICEDMHTLFNLLVCRC